MGYEPHLVIMAYQKPINKDLVSSVRDYLCKLKVFLAKRDKTPLYTKIITGYELIYILFMLYVVVLMPMYLLW